MVLILIFTKKVLLSFAFALLVQGVAITQLDSNLKDPKDKRYTAGFLSLDLAISRNQKHSNFTKGPYYVVESNEKRDGYISVVLYNEQVEYSANISVGSNNQLQNVVIDTGSSDLWVVDTFAVCQPQSGYSPDYCFSGGSYNPLTSSTVQRLGSAFEILYGDGSSSTGIWVKDTVEINGAVITQQQFGDVYSTSVDQGILGIGLVANEASNTLYDNVPISLKQQGHISTAGYSLYLNSPDADTGSIIFGGIDHAKYSGSLTFLPITSNTELRLQANSVTIGLTTVNINAGLLLDSGTTLTYLSADVLTGIAIAIGGDIRYYPLLGAYVWSCNRVGNVTYNFSQGVRIRVPYSDLTVPLYHSDGSLADVCALGILDGGTLNILGENFLRHAYAAYNLDNQTIGLAQVVYTSKSDITTF